MVKKINKITFTTVPIFYANQVFKMRNLTITLNGNYFKI